MKIDNRVNYRSAVMLPDFGEIQRLVSQGRYEFSIHAQRERLADDLDVVDIEKAIAGGALLEEYLNDPRGWSCLVLGYAAETPVHIVLGWARSRTAELKALRVITVYIPKPLRWRAPPGPEEI